MKLRSKVKAYIKSLPYSREGCINIKQEIDEVTKEITKNFKGDFNKWMEHRKFKSWFAANCLS